MTNLRSSNADCTTRNCNGAVHHLNFVATFVIYPTFLGFLVVLYINIHYIAIFILFISIAFLAGFVDYFYYVRYAIGLTFVVLDYLSFTICGAGARPINANDLLHLVIPLLLILVSFGFSSALLILIYVVGLINVFLVGFLYYHC